MRKTNLNFRISLSRTISKSSIKLLDMKRETMRRARTSGLPHRSIALITIRIPTTKMTMMRRSLFSKKKRNSQS
jgi:hypothetical protein